LVKARQILAIQGIGAFLEEVGARLRYRLMHSSGEISYDTFRSRDWDRRRGVETEISVKRESLDFDSPNRAHAKNYDPSSLWAFREVMGILWNLGVRPPEFALVDFGCGKGRVLLTAIEARFREVIGVEFAPELARCASENLCSYRGRRRDALVHCTDAAAFPIPEGPLVAFLFNPFTGPVLEAVAANISRSYEDHPRPIYVVYLNPEPDSPFGRGLPFALVESAPSHAIYRLKNDGP
jgi:hypothetical protein